MRKVSKGLQFLSYLFPISLKKVSSNDQKPLQLKLIKGQFVLYEGEALYSHGKNYYPFRIPFIQSFQFLKNKEKVLVLGTGIGSVGMILSDLYPENNWMIDYVDINQSILTACEDVMQYFPKINAKYINQDAFDYLQKSGKKYDIICVDIFDEYMVPPQFLSVDFVNLLHNQALKNHASVFINVMFAPGKSQENFESLLKASFKYYKSNYKNGNCMYNVNDN